MCSNRNAVISLETVIDRRVVIATRRACRVVVVLGHMVEQTDTTIHGTLERMLRLCVDLCIWRQKGDE